MKHSNMGTWDSSKWLLKKIEFLSYPLQFSAISLIRAIYTIEFVITKKCIADLLTRPVTIAVFQVKKI